MSPEDIAALFANTQEKLSNNMVVSAKVLVKSNASLAKSRKELTEANKKLTSQLAEASKHRGGCKTADGGCPCKHCKNKSKQPKHRERECWELPGNVSKRPKDWASCL